MLYQGLKNLILVSPRENWPNKKAFDVSANANIIIKKTKVFASVKAALSPFHYVIATSARNRYLQKLHQNNFSLLFEQIPSNKKFRSLNLSHSLIIIAQIVSSLITLKKIKFKKSKKIKSATKKEIMNMLDFCIKNLENTMKKT